MVNVICGIIKKPKKFYFNFDVEKSILTIQPVRMKHYGLLILESYYKDVPQFKDRVDLEGETNYNTYIRFINVKFNSIGGGCFCAWVPAYIKGINSNTPIIKPNKIKKIVFKGECIDRFMSSKSIATNRWDVENSNIQIDVDYSKDKVRTFSYNNMNFSFIPGWEIKTKNKDVSNYLIMKTVLKVESEKEIRIKSVMDIYKIVEKFLSFACYRQSVQFESIILNQIIHSNCGTDSINTIVEFELHISKSNDDSDLPDIGHNMELNDYVEKVPLLMKCLCDNDFILLSFPKNKLMVSLIDNNSYINTSSTFESEFDLLNPKFKSTRKKNYNDAKTIVLDYINKQSKNTNKYNNKIRDYFKNLYEYIDECEGRLEEQINYALNEYSYIVEPERKHYIREYSNVDFSNNCLAKAYADKRNNLSHGSKLERYKPIEIAAYSIVKRINYAMILDRAGFDQKQIIEIIEKVF